MEAKEILEELLAEYKKEIVLIELDCSDNSCYYKARGSGGMRTNGGCRCSRNYPHKVDRLLRHAIHRIEIALEKCNEQK